MKIEESIVYCLATSNRGMHSEQISDMINRQQIHLSQIKKNRTFVKYEQEFTDKKQYG